MDKLTISEAKRLNDTMVTEEHLKLHAANVAACMGAMAEYFGADKEHWEAVGYLHDYDYEKYPEEHLAHTEEPLRAAGVPEEDIRAIMSHGYSICTDVEPRTEMEKSLFTVDELSGIIQAAARMRPTGIERNTLRNWGWLTEVGSEQGTLEVVGYRLVDTSKVSNTLKVSDKGVRYPEGSERKQDVSRKSKKVSGGKRIPGPGH